MSTIHYRDRKPAVCVKDHTVWARDSRTADMIADLPEKIVDMVYEGVRGDFWHFFAPEIAREHGYVGTVYSAGRSEGWLILEDGLLWPDYIIEDGTIPPAADDADEHTRAEYAHMIAERERWIRFSSAIDDAVKGAGAQFVDALREHVEDVAFEASESAYWAARDVMTVEA